MFKVIIAGSRSFNQYDLIKAKLDFYFSNRLPAVEIVSGTVRGADVLGEKIKGYSSLLRVVKALEKRR